MKKLLLLLLILNTGCATPQVISTPPEAYVPSRPTNDKELITEWQQSLIKIKEWQSWYDIQVGTNFFYQRHEVEEEVIPVWVHRSVNVTN